VISNLKRMVKNRPMEGFDFQEPDLRHVFRFIGLTDLAFIHA
jgi:FMN-dependent NADH-azoreductase